MRKIIIAGGSGFVGKALAAHLSQTCDVVILSREYAPSRSNIRTVQWDAQHLGGWTDELEGCYAIVNLTGKNVNCRYTPENKKEILESRTLSTRILGKAVTALKNPPQAWIQMSSATVYRHSLDKPMDEVNGEVGDDFSMNVVKEWEKTFNSISLQKTRKVILRTSIVMGSDGGAVPPLVNLVKFGLGGPQGKGNQMVSWIHINDVVGIIDWMLNGDARGVYNVTSPNPIPNRELMRTFRNACGASFGLPSPEWLLKLGAVLIGTETELVLKSRWVVPARLLEEGYKFSHPSSETAIRDVLQ